MKICMRMPINLAVARAISCSIFGLVLCCTGALVHAGTEALVYEDQILAMDGERRTVRVPRGYRLELLSRMDAPRMLTFAANGDLFAGFEIRQGISFTAPLYQAGSPGTGGRLSAQRGIPAGRDSDCQDRRGVPRALHARTIKYSAGWRNVAGRITQRGKA